MDMLMRPNPQLVEMTEKLETMGTFFEVKIGKNQHRTIVTNLRPGAKVECMVISGACGNIEVFLWDCDGKLVTDVEKFEMGNSNHLSGVPTTMAVLDILKIMQL